MSAYLLDANAIIDFLKNKDPGVSSINNLKEKSFYIEPIAFSEVLYGIERSPHPIKNRKYFDRFLSKFSVRPLEINMEVAKTYIKTKIYLEKDGKRLADFDLLIACSAITNNLTLVTKNTKHFQRIPKLKIFKQ